jgi:hypothetical protein
MANGYGEMGSGYGQMGGGYGQMAGRGGNYTSDKGTYRHSFMHGWQFHPFVVPKEPEDNNPVVKPAQINILQTPENPGVRKEAYSTYGVSIPISVGRRIVTGNVIDATDLTPVLIGGKTTITEIKVPVYLEEYGPE